MSTFPATVEELQAMYEAPLAENLAQPRVPGKPPS